VIKQKSPGVLTFKVAGQITATAVGVRRQPVRGLQDATSRTGHAAAGVSRDPPSRTERTGRSSFQPGLQSAVVFRRATCPPPTDNIRRSRRRGEKMVLGFIDG
jgi:hypothetical protein